MSEQPVIGLRLLFIWLFSILKPYIGLWKGSVDIRESETYGISAQKWEINHPVRYNNDETMIVRERKEEPSLPRRDVSMQLNTHHSTTLVEKEGSQSSSSTGNVRKSSNDYIHEVKK